MEDHSRLQKIVSVVILFALLLGSRFGIADFASSPESYAKSIAALDEKKMTVMELTAATAVASVAISAVPGDATTPIADQIAEFSSYLLVITGVILLEKFLLTLTGYLTFTWLIPIACVLGIIYTIWGFPYFKKLAIRLTVFGLAICLIIPVSIKVGTIFEDTFELQTTVEQAEEGSQELQDENADSSAADTDSEDQSQTGLGGMLAQFGATLTSGVSQAVDKAKATLNHFIDAIAVLVISNCVIPILVMLLFIELAKSVFPTTVEGIFQKAVEVRAHYHGKRQRKAIPPADDSE